MKLPNKTMRRMLGLTALASLFIVSCTPQESAQETAPAQQTTAAGTEQTDAAETAKPAGTTAAGTAQTDAAETAKPAGTTAAGTEQTEAAETSKAAGTTEAANSAGTAQTDAAAPTRAALPKSIQSSSSKTEKTEKEGAVFEPEEGSLLASLPEVTEGEYVRDFDMGEGAEMVTYRVDSLDDIDSYEDKLEADGFENYSENPIEDNYYASWVSDDTAVTLIYMPDFDGLMRVVAEPKGSLPALETEKFETICTPEMAMVGVDYDGEQKNGMCFIYRLSDGSFVIVDSGSKNSACADAIYDTLKEMAVDPENIVIAAWFITHGHSDHIGGFLSFTDKYADQVKVEKFIINFPTQEIFTATDIKVDYITKMKECAARYPGAEMYEAHPGQVYHIRDAEFTILYTWEMYPVNEQLTYFNNTSLVFTIELGEEKILQFGDCGPVASRVMQIIYSGDTIKSDIVQVAHHGYKGAVTGLNEMVEPEVALWPTNMTHYETDRVKDYNMVFDDVEHTYVADQDVYVFGLPFDEDNVEIWPAYEE